LRFYPLEKIAEAITLDDGDEYRKSPAAAKKLKLVKSTDTAEAKKLGKTDKETLLTQGYVIIDDRAKDEKSSYGAVDYLKKFTNPDESGFYSYITKLGGLRYGLLIVRPKQLQQDFATDDTLVIDLDSKDGTTYIKDHQGVFIKDQIRVQDYSTAHKMMVDVAEGKPGYSNVYILINENLKATQPFRINANFKAAIIGDILKNPTLFGTSNTDLEAQFDAYWINGVGNIKTIFDDENSITNSFLDFVENNTLKNYFANLQEAKCKLVHLWKDQAYEIATTFPKSLFYFRGSSSIPQ
jgi:hypothetical protein